MIRLIIHFTDILRSFSVSNRKNFFKYLSCAVEPANPIRRSSSEHSPGKVTIYQGIAGLWNLSFLIPPAKPFEWFAAHAKLLWKFSLIFPIYIASNID